MAAAATAWTHFLTRSLATRLDPDTFSSYAELLSTKYLLPKSHLCEIFLRPTSENDASLDPRIPRFLQVLLGLELVDTPGILRALWKWSSFGKDAENSGDGEESGKAEGARKKRWSSSYASEEMLFYRLAKHISSGAGPRNNQEAVKLVLVCIQWMEIAAVASHGADEMLGLGGHAEDMGAATMALGTLLVAVVENGRVVGAFRGLPKGLYIYYFCGKKRVALLLSRGCR